MIVTELIAIYRDLTFLYDNRGNIHLEESFMMRYPTLSDYKLIGVYNKYYNEFKNELIETFLEQGITPSETKIDNPLSRP